MDKIGLGKSLIRASLDSYDRQALKSVLKNLPREEIDSLGGIYGAADLSKFESMAMKDIARARALKILQERVNPDVAEARLYDTLGLLVESPNAFYLPKNTIRNPKGYVVLNDLAGMTKRSKGSYNNINATAHELGHHARASREGIQTNMDMEVLKRLLEHEGISDDEYKTLWSMASRPWKPGTPHHEATLKTQKGLGDFGVSKAAEEVFSDAYAGRLLDDPRWDTLPSEVKYAVKRYLPLFLGVAGAGALSQSDVAEAKMPSKGTLKAVNNILKEWYQKGAMYVGEGGEVIQMGHPKWDSVSAVESILEESPALKKAITEADIESVGKINIFRPDILIQQLDELSGVSHKKITPDVIKIKTKEKVVPKTQEEIKTERKALAKEEPKPSSTPTKTSKGKKIPFEWSGPYEPILKGSRQIPMSESVANTPPSSANSILKDYGVLKMEGVKVKEFRVGRGVHRYAVLDNGNVIPMTKDELRSFVRDRGAEFYSDFLKSRGNKAKEFQVLSSAERRLQEHKKIPLDSRTEWALRDRYVRNVEKVRPERDSAEDKAMIKFGGKVMQIPKAYADLLLKMEEATMAKRPAPKKVKGEPK